MRAELAFLLVLIGLALLAVALLQPYRHNCRALEREAALSSGVMAICATNIACHYDYRDLRIVVKQRIAAEQCRSRDR